MRSDIGDGDGGGAYKAHLFIVVFGRCDEDNGVLIDNGPVVVK